MSRASLQKLQSLSRFAAQRPLFCTIPEQRCVVSRVVQLLQTRRYTAMHDPFGDRRHKRHGALENKIVSDAHSLISLLQIPFFLKALDSVEELELSALEEGSQRPDGRVPPQEGRELENPSAFPR